MVAKGLVELPEMADQDTSQLPMGAKRSAPLPVPQLLGIVGVVALVAVPWFVWGDRLGSPTELSEGLRGLSSTTQGLVVLPLVLALALILFVPVTPILVGCGLVFEPSRGVPIALAGTLLGAMGGWALGRVLGAPLLRRVRGPRLRTLMRRLRRQPLRATIFVRLVPVGSFTVINVMAGAVRIPFRWYLLGNVIGLLPGVLLVTGLGGNLFAMMGQPELMKVVLAVAAMVILGGVVIGLRRWAQRESS